MKKKQKISAKFGVFNKARDEVYPLLKISEFPYSTVSDIRMVDSAPKKQVDPFSGFDRTLVCDGQTDTRTDTGPQVTPR